MTGCSIVIPTFNSESYIEKSLRTAMAQKNGPFEIIVVDDGSSDGTVSKVEAVLDGYPGPVQILRQPSNMGVSAARNRGWRAATSEWVQFLDSDDFLHPEKLSLQLAAVRANPKIDAVYSGFECAYVEGDRTVTTEVIQNRIIHEKLPLALLAAKNLIHPGSLIMRRRALEVIGGYDETLRIWEDITLLMCLLESKARFHYLASNMPLYTFRLYPEQPRMGGDEARYRLEQVCTLWLNQLERFGSGRILEEQGLALEDLQFLRENATTYLRELFLYNRDSFRQFHDRLLRLYPTYKPTGSRPFQVLTGLLGFEKAETLISKLRRIRKK